VVQKVQYEFIGGNYTLKNYKNRYTVRKLLLLLSYAILYLKLYANRGFIIELHQEVKILDRS